MLSCERYFNHPAILKANEIARERAKENPQVYLSELDKMQILLNDFYKDDVIKNTY